MMENTNQSRRNFAPWAAIILILVALLANGLFFINIPGHGAIPWLSLLLSLVALSLLVLGIWRAFALPHIYRGKISSPIIGAILVVPFGIAIWSFHHARDLPVPAGAPQVGEKAPDFSLADTSGKSVPLSNLLSAPLSNSSTPKAVLLIFYRGFW